MKLSTGRDLEYSKIGLDIEHIAAGGWSDFGSGISGGYDTDFETEGQLGWMLPADRAAEIEYNSCLTHAECVELAEKMIRAWIKFRDYQVGKALGVTQTAQCHTPPDTPTARP